MRTKREVSPGNEKLSTAMAKFPCGPGRKSLNLFLQVEKLSELKEKAERSLEEQVEQAKEVDIIPNSIIPCMTLS